MTLARRTVAGALVGLAALSAWPVLGAAAAPSGATAQAWYRGVVKDLHPLQSTLLGSLNAASGWSVGSESATAARREFARDLPRLEWVHGILARVAPLAGHTSARDDYVSAIGLYIQSLKLDEAATEVPAGALQGQLQHSSQRVRELGDTVFDQGTAELAPLLGSTIAGADVTAASRIPDWPAVGLAPQPPLAPVWRASGTARPGSQPKAAWTAELEMDGAPAQAKVRAALTGHPSPSTLAQLVVALGTAEAYVTSVPGPAGDARAAARLRLGLLVDAESVMAAEAAHLGHGAPSHALAAVASALGSIGGQLRAEGDDVQ